MRLVAVVLVLVFATARAHADDPTTTAPDDDSKSMLAAEAMSLAPAALGMFYFWVSNGNGSSEDSPSTQRSNFIPAAVLLTVGPSLGHLYTHSWKLAAIGAVARLGGSLLVMDGYGRCDSSRPPDDFGNCYVTGLNYTEQRWGMAIIGLTALAQLIDAPLSVQRYNRAHAHTVIVPTGAPGSIGLAIAGTF